MGERHSWSDVSGSISMPAKDDYELPTLEEISAQAEDFEHLDGKLQWIESDWHLDTDWAPLDAQGWQYSDNFWEQQKGRRALTSFTRRRKWVRHLTFEEASVKKD